MLVDIGARFPSERVLWATGDWSLRGFIITAVESSKVARDEWHE